MYLIVALLSIRNREQLICISSQALVGLDCGTFVCCLAGPCLFFNTGARPVGGDRSDSGDRSVHVVAIPRPGSQYIFFADFRGVSDCLLRPVGCDTDFGCHGESQICRHINSFSFSATKIPTGIRFIFSLVKRSFDGRPTFTF